VGLVLIGDYHIGFMLIGMDEAGTQPEPEPETSQSFYFNLAGYDLSGKVLVPIKAKGFSKSTTSWSIPSRIYSKIRESGVKSLEWEFSVVFPDHAEANAFRRKCNSLVENVNWFAGSRDWYYIVKYASVSPNQIDEDIYHVTLDVNLFLEDPLLRSARAQSWSLTSASLPANSCAFDTLLATADSPFDRIRVVGKYYNGSHLKDLSVTLMHGGEEITSALLSNKLLSDEILTLDGNRINTEYVEDFPSSVRITQDAYAMSNVVVSGGKATISPGGYLTYKLSGPNPTLENVLLQATINVISGNPSIRTSVDNSNWENGVLASELSEVSGIYTDFYLSGTDKRGDVYVQFYCPAGASIEIEFLRLSTVREIYLKKDFVIPAGEKEYSVKIEDGTSSSHVANIQISFYQRRYP